MPREHEDRLALPDVTRSVFITLVTLLWVSRTAVTAAPTPAAVCVCVLLVVF